MRFRRARFYLARLNDRFKFNFIINKFQADDEKFIYFFSFLSPWLTWERNRSTVWQRRFLPPLLPVYHFSGISSWSSKLIYENKMENLCRFWRELFLCCSEKRNDWRCRRLKNLGADDVIRKKSRESGKWENYVTFSLKSKTRVGIIWKQCRNDDKRREHEQTRDNQSGSVDFYLGIMILMKQIPSGHEWNVNEWNGNPNFDLSKNPHKKNFNEREREGGEGEGERERGKTHHQFVILVIEFNESFFSAGKYLIFVQILGIQRGINVDQLTRN